MIVVVVFVFDYLSVKISFFLILFSYSILLPGPAASHAAVIAAAASLISVETACLLLTKCLKTRVVNIFDFKVLTTLLQPPDLSAGFCHISSTANGFLVFH